MTRVDELRLGLIFASPERAAAIERQIALLAIADVKAWSEAVAESVPTPFDAWPEFPANTDWRERRRLLRDAGFEVKQFDGALYVDGRPCADPRLLPPGTRA